ncbi:MAG: hypothetical protein OH316_01735 [Candidatus Parvarchaeota archaeon]|nr:hypothetical protein [Candidatus Parvarchaeota archaeon]
MKMEDLPKLEECDYFKSSQISYEGRIERVIIYKLKTNGDYTFRFTCPRCGHANRFNSSLNLIKKKEEGKSRDYISFRCEECGTDYLVEKFKIAAKGLKKV